MTEYNRHTEQAAELQARRQSLLGELREVEALIRQSQGFSPRNLMGIVEGERVIQLGKPARLVEVANRKVFARPALVSQPPDDIA